MRMCPPGYAAVRMFFVLSSCSGCWRLFLLVFILLLQWMCHDRWNKHKSMLRSRRTRLWCIFIFPLTIFFMYMKIFNNFLLFWQWVFSCSFCFVLSDLSCLVRFVFRCSWCSIFGICLEIFYVIREMIFSLFYMNVVLHFILCMSCIVNIFDFVLFLAWRRHNKVPKRCERVILL